VQKGIEEARKNLFDVPIAGTTIVYPVIGASGAGRVLMKPAAPGTGVIAGGAARAILEMAGVKDIIAKSLGSPNGINVATPRSTDSSNCVVPRTSRPCATRRPSTSSPRGPFVPTASVSARATCSRRRRSP